MTALLTNAAAGASPTFQHRGGKFMIIWQATLGGGNLAVQVLSGDGSTYVPVGTAMTALGAQVFEAPKGVYRVNVTTSTANYATYVPF